MYEITFDYNGRMGHRRKAAKRVVILWWSEPVYDEVIADNIRGQKTRVEQELSANRWTRLIQRFCVEKKKKNVRGVKVNTNVYDFADIWQNDANNFASKRRPLGVRNERRAILVSSKQRGFLCTTVLHFEMAVDENIMREYYEHWDIRVYAALFFEYGR